MPNAVRTTVRGIGQILITLGVVVLLFIGYELWFTDVLNARTQHRLTTKLEKQWSEGDDPLVRPSGSPSGSASPGPGGQPLPGESVRQVPLGTGIAIIRIPRFGLDYARTIVQGTGEAQLNDGPGHYVDSPLPGAVGNVAIAGHRVSKGSPFLDLDKLLPGDAIVIETKDFWYTYRVLGDAATGSFTANTPDGIPGREIVSSTDSEVLDPVPDHPGQRPTMRMITLTTCHPKFSASHRMIVHGLLAGVPYPRSAGDPPALRPAG